MFSAITGLCKVLHGYAQPCFGPLVRVNDRSGRHALTALHWLDVADRVTYKLGIIMQICRHGKAPQYLAVGRQRLN